MRPLHVLHPGAVRPGHASPEAKHAGQMSEWGPSLVLSLCDPIPRGANPRPCLSTLEGSKKRQSSGGTWVGAGRRLPYEWQSSPEGTEEWQEAEMMQTLT